MFMNYLTPDDHGISCTVNLRIGAPVCSFTVGRCR